MRFLLLFFVSISLLMANETSVKIGVLAKRGAEVTFKKWNATAQYLSKNIPNYTFEIIPLSFSDIYTTVENKEIDFILANSGYYVVLEHDYGVQRITTLVNKHVAGLSQKQFGGVLFTHIDNKNRFNSLQSIKGSHFAAVNKNSLGGWQMAWRELVEEGMDKDSDLASISFQGTHDKVVYAILNKEVDVGTVRTDTLERMAIEKKIDLNKIHIINPLSYEDFPFFISTKLYPEWPLAKLKHTSDTLSKLVAISLMQMASTSQAAKNAKIDSWSTPLSYQPVHACFKVLEIPPYYQAIEFWSVVNKYKFWILFYLIAGLIGLTMLVYQYRLTHFLKKTQNELVQTEKMASLGRLVAGIAHEVNTPLGICVTAASLLTKEIKSFNKKYKDESLTQSDFEEYIETTIQSSDIVTYNLDRAANIIRNFKQVSVDQSSDEIREFALKEYLESIITNLQPTLKNHHHTIEVNCTEALHVQSNPGVFYQIFSNLIINSVIHGFEEKEHGSITIDASQKDNKLTIIYKDNGKGMSKENLKKVFDPFFTTRRSSGGSGLGTHIIYNLVTQKLHGTISASSHQGHDMTYTIILKV